MSVSSLGEKFGMASQYINSQELISYIESLEQTARSLANALAVTCLSLIRFFFFLPPLSFPAS